MGRNHVKESLQFVAFLIRQDIKKSTRFLV